ncbi:DUF1538 domain-containing protein [Desulfobulbus alkaliphilus]|uniref:DUF1538 domain-containing protein n=1 Tax=Desulfobulbus alkaliphilus TaxID=869814 RepID=UPI001963D5CB|nr:DUF1538 domain-containing protein [Desulfobulbus alkaliphilus]MBM9537883.1 DUF1538 domain-containing protein [Desulfobulbus alkaliphilus]
MNELLDFLDCKEIILEVIMALGPLVLFFLVFQIFFLKLPIEYVKNLLKGVALTFIGLVLFLQGVTVGFLPVGSAMGEVLGSMENRWLIIPIGFLLGFVATIAEPAVRILSYEVERTSGGSIRSQTILATLALGVSVFMALGMVRILYGIPILYLVIPAYLIVLVMLKFSDPTFTSIAFDAGGVATGPMTVTFVLAIAVGIATAMPDRDAIADGFGLIALVALAPILSVMILGLLYSRK